jgi:hypothetical protein
MARELGCSTSQLWRTFAGQVDGISVTRLAEIGSVLGLELSLSFHPLGDPIRDQGQQALAKRFRALVADGWRAAAEVPLPGAGDLRAWDFLLRLGDQRVGVELETRIRDIQALARRIHQRERDGGVSAILIVLADSATNRRMADELREALGVDYSTSPRAILAALRTSRPLPGSGVILV